MSYDIDFTNQRIVDGCTFLDVDVALPDQHRGFLIYGIGSADWDIVFPSHITPGLLDGIDIPGVTFFTRKDGGITARDFPTLEAAKRFVIYLYERFYEAFYLGLDTYTVEPSQAADTAADLARLTAEKHADALDEAGDIVMAMTSPKSARTFQLSASRFLKYKAQKCRESLLFNFFTRSVPAPLTRDGAAHRVALCSTPERVTFYPPAMDAPPTTLIHTHPRNTQ